MSFGSFLKEKAKKLYQSANNYYQECQELEMKMIDFDTKRLISIYKNYSGKPKYVARKILIDRGVMSPDK